MNADALSAILALLAGPLAAQACQSFNDQNNNVGSALTASSPSGYDVRAWQFTPTTGFGVMSAQIYTGNTVASANPRFMTLEIWRHNPATNEPLAALTRGTWQVSSNLGVGWQGVNFDLQTPLIPPNVYWLVWHEPGSSRIPAEPGGSTLLPTLRAPSGAGWAPQPAEALKCRLYCSYLDPAGMARMGNPCITSTGRYGTLFSNQPPVLGNAAFALEGTGFPTAALTVLALGTNGPVTFVPGLPPGCASFTDIVTAMVATTGNGTVLGPTAIGHVTWPLPIPGNIGLRGLTFSAQIATLDPFLPPPLNGTLHLVVSNGLRVTVL